MATAAKKSTPRSTKPTTKSKATTVRKKPVAKKATAMHMRSFYLCEDPNEFMSVKPSVQSFYWLLIGVAVLILVSWTMYLTLQIQAIYDTIEVSNASSYIVTK